MKKYTKEELAELSKTAKGAVAVSVYGTFLNEEQYKARKDDKEVLALTDLKPAKDPDPEADARKQLAARYKELYNKYPAKALSAEEVQTAISEKEAESAKQ